MPEPLTDEELAGLWKFARGERDFLIDPHVVVRLLDEHKALREEVKPWRAYTAQQAARDQDAHDRAHKLEVTSYEWEVRAVEAEATAARRLELLREVEWATEIQGDEECCPICYGRKPYPLNEFREGHTPDCKLAKELEG